MTYNLTFMDNVTSPLGLIEGVNTASNNVLGTTLILFFWLVLFISFSSFTIKDRLLASSFITSIAGGLLLGAGLIAWWVLVFPLISSLAAAIFKLWGDG